MCLFRRGLFTALVLTSLTAMMPRGASATQFIFDSLSVLNSITVNSGFSPELLLSQNTLLGLPARTWAVAGTDLFFDVLDLTSGTTPFFIDAGTPTGSFVISSSGRVGLGTFAPQGNLHIFGGAFQDVFNGIGPDLLSGPALNFGYSGASFGRSSGFFNVRPDIFAIAPNPSVRFLTQNIQRMIIANNGNVGIGQFGAVVGVSAGTSPLAKLHVQGDVWADGTFISNGIALNVPDYVFEPEYKLMPLPDLAAYVKTEKHLPDIPSARTIKEKGVNITETQMQILRKVEELTLYILEQQKTIEGLKKETEQLHERLRVLEPDSARKASGARTEPIFFGRNECESGCGRTKQVRGCGPDCSQSAAQSP